MEVNSVCLADHYSFGLRSWSWGGLHTLLQVGPVGHYTRPVVGSGRVQRDTGLQWQRKLLVVGSGSRGGADLPYQMCCWPCSCRGMPQRSTGDGWLCAFTQVFASQTCAAPSSCRCGSTAVESVGTDLSGAGALLLLLSMLSSAWQKLGQT